jgi:hypothetical protein
LPWARCNRVKETSPAIPGPIPSVRRRFEIRVPSSEKKMASGTAISAVMVGTVGRSTASGNGDSYFFERRSCSGAVGVPEKVA